MGNFIDLTDQRFGRLTVIERAENSKDGKARWVCRCDCGKQTVVVGNHLRSNAIQSCGCFSKETTLKRCRTHGATKGRLYRIWCNMKRRCSDPKNISYTRYGQCGISVCSEWMNFEAFSDWALSHGYRDDLSIDRIDSGGDYCPENCRWADSITQSNNRRSNRHLTFCGKTHTMAEWAKIVQISEATLWSRIKAGWTVERALTEPVQQHKK